MWQQMYLKMIHLYFQVLAYAVYKKASTTTVPSKKALRGAHWDNFSFFSYF